MAQDDMFSSGGTLEFLKLMGTVPAETKGDADVSVAPAARQSLTSAVPDPLFDAPDASASAVPGVPSVPGADLAADETIAIPASSQPAAQADKPSTSGQPVQPAPAFDSDRPVVIKGGPRRVTRADGRNPRLGTPMGQRRFELPSGHAMFAPRPHNRALSIAVPLVMLALIGVGGAFAYTHAEGASTEHSQQALIATTGYDGALSLSPAKDGGYYTVFLVTSTPTDETQIGDLSSVVMYRTDHAVAGSTSATRVDVPADLYVTPYSAYSKNYYLLSETLKQTQNITRTLQAIIDELGVRLYNVVCCSQDEYDRINAYMDGSSSDASVFDEGNLLGRVRTNLSPENLQAFCDSIRAIGMSNIKEFAVPTTALGAGDVMMERTSPASYQQALEQALSNIKYDEHGNYAGTQYDENGNPILDEKGNPQGAIYTDYANNQLYFDENGYLVFYGQHYDANGYPVGTQYDDAGNPLLDDNGNPQGTVYGDDGEPERDWLGNIVIQNG